MGCGGSIAAQDVQLLQMAYRRREAHCHDLSCRDPLLACMALVASAELAYVAGFRTPPLTPMMMHLVNTLASEVLVKTTLPHTTQASPNWWRNVEWDGTSAPQEADRPLCWRRVRLAMPTDCEASTALTALSDAAPKLAALHLCDLIRGRRVELPAFPYLTALTIIGTGVSLDVLSQSVPNLTSLECDGHDALDLSALAFLTHLRRIRLHRLRNLTNFGLAALGRCAKLQTLSIRDCPRVTDVSRVTCLAACQELQELDAQGSHYLTNAAVSVCIANPSCQRLLIDNPTNDDIARLAQLDRTVFLSLRVASHAAHVSSKCNSVLLQLVHLRQRSVLLTSCEIGLSNLFPTFDVTPLALLPALAKLSIYVHEPSSNAVCSVVGSLEGAPALTSLLVTGVTESAFRDGLFAVRTLKEIKIFASLHLEDASRLDECPNVTSLLLFGCGIKLSSMRRILTSWQNLTRLDVIECPNVAEDLVKEFCPQFDHILTNDNATMHPECCTWWCRSDC